MCRKWGGAAARRPSGKTAQRARRKGFPPAGRATVGTSGRCGSVLQSGLGILTGTVALIGGPEVRERAGGSALQPLGEIAKFRSS